jgi:hypothetical protein
MRRIGWVVILACACSSGTSSLGDGGQQFDSGSGTMDAATDAGVRVDAGASDPFDPAAVAMAYTHAICEYEARCGLLALFTGLTEAECEAANMDAALIATTEENDAIQGGRIAFHQAAFSACLSYLGTIDCESGTGASNPCGGALVGLRAEQQGCYIDQECASGLYCAGKIAGRCGLCERRVAAGGACPVSDECADGTTCDSTSHTCIENDVQVGQPCSTNKRCSGFLECINGTCTRLAEANQTCDRMAMQAPNCNFLEGL